MRKWWPWAVFFVLLGCAAYSQFLNQPQQQGPRVQPKQETAQGVSGDHKANNAAPAHESPSGKPQEAHNGHDAESGEILGVKRGEWLLFFATLLLWYATMRLVWDARQNAQRQLRAYLFVDKIDCSIEGNEVHLELKNSGQTPAYNIRQWTAASLRPLANPGTFERIDVISTPFDVGPGGTAHVRFPPPTRARTERQTIIDGPNGLFVFGEIFYRDAFEVERWTRFRLVQAGASNVEHARVEACTEGNEAS